MQIGNDEAAHNASNPKNARETGNPQADAFRQPESSKNCADRDH
jgi:hypothetical protein